MSTGGGQAEAQQAVRHAAGQARTAAASRAHRDTLVREMFAQPVRDCAYRCVGRPVSVLRARLAPSRPGPFPAVYEKAASDRGIQAYMQLRGLIISQRETARALPACPDRLTRAVGAACRFICWLTRGRLTDAHDEVRYVIKKPEDRFARVV